MIEKIKVRKKSKNEKNIICDNCNILLLPEELVEGECPFCGMELDFRELQMALKEHQDLLVLMIKTVLNLND